MQIFSRHAEIIKISSFATKSIIPNLNVKDFGIENEPVLEYLNGSKESVEIKARLKHVSENCEDVPIVIGDKEFRTDAIQYQVMPHNHSKRIASFYYADDKLVKKAIANAVETQVKWDRTPIDERIRIWHKAADLMAGPYRQELNAATMLGQAKTVVQAEIDSSAELIDFIRFNAYFLKENLKYQPISPNISVTRNSLRYRGLDGFIAAVSPFNFTAIGGNLAYTPALMVWLYCYFFKLLIMCTFIVHFECLRSFLRRYIRSLCEKNNVWFGFLSRVMPYYGSHLTQLSYRIGLFSKLCVRPEYHLV